MLEPQIVEDEPMTVAFIQKSGSYEQIPKCFGMLYSYVSQNGWTPCGPPRGIYLTPPDAAEVRWELWAPIAEEEEERGPDSLGLGVQRIDDARTMASVLHVGAYDNLAETYEGLQRWIGKHGYQIVGPSEEIYYSDPGEVPPDEYRTDIRFPVRKA